MTDHDDSSGNFAPYPRRDDGSLWDYLGKVKPGGTATEEQPERAEQLELPLVFSTAPYRMTVMFGDRKFVFGPYKTLSATQRAMDLLADMMGAMGVVKGLNKVSGNWHGTVKQDPYDDESKKWVVWSCYPSQEVTRDR